MDNDQRDDEPRALVVAGKIVDMYAANWKPRWREALKDDIADALHDAYNDGFYWGVRDEKLRFLKIIDSVMRAPSTKGE